MNCETIHDVFKAFPLAYRKDYGGFVLVAYQLPSGLWEGRGWRSADWKPFHVHQGCASREAVFDDFRRRIDVLKELVGAP